MCTVSWISEPEGYCLFCNRDEKRTRKPAFLPRTMERLGVRFVAPIDADFGGSWIGANEFGLTLTLLNGPSATRGTFKSRGLLLMELLSAPSRREVASRIQGVDLHSFQPFTLASVEPGGASVLEWDLRNLRPGTGKALLASSSYDHAAANAARAADLRRLSHTFDPQQTLRRLHHSHWPSPGAFSACMHRADAETVSFSEVRVSADTIEFLYSPAAPCRGVPPESRLLARRT